MPILSRHFAHPHPLFRKSKTARGVPWRESVYFLWWEYLRRHEGYRRECEHGGGGKYAKLYEDFGDVHAVDFKTWWRTGDRGARLFAEPPAVDTVRAVHPRDIGELSAGWDEVAMLVVAIPLALSKRDIARRVSELVAGVCRRGRGERMSGQSRARYRVATHFNRHSLETALRVYDLKGRMPLWRIAQELKMGTLLTDEELNAPRGSPVRVSKQERLAIAASRKFRMAKRIIEGTGRGVFPALSASSRTL